MAWYSICTILLLICLMGAGGGSATVEVWMEGQEGMYTVYTDGLSAVTDGRVAALRLELIVTGGEVQVETGQRGVTVTTVRMDGGRIRVLADGVFAEDTVCRITGKGDVRIAHVDAYGYLSAEGEVERFSLRVRQDEEEGTTEKSDKETTWTVESGTESGVVEKSTGTMCPLETHTEPESGCTDEREGRYIGCRETAVWEGMYAAQFLFAGTEGAPVICVEGGGVLTVRCERGESVGCTFYGLRAEGTYRFWIYDGSVVIEAVYENGMFHDQYVKSGLDYWSY